MSFLIIEFLNDEQYCVNGNIRLVDGSVPSEGRIEICIHNSWGTVCHNGWDYNDANVLCGQLGYQRYGTIVLGHVYVHVHVYAVYSCRCVLTCTCICCAVYRC